MRLMCSVWILDHKCTNIGHCIVFYTVNVWITFSAFKHAFSVQFLENVQKWRRKKEQEKSKRIRRITKGRNWYILHPDLHRGYSLCHILLPVAWGKGITMVFKYFLPLESNLDYGTLRLLDLNWLKPSVSSGKQEALENQPNHFAPGNR